MSMHQGLFPKESSGAISPGATFHHDFRGKVNLRCKGEEKPAAKRIRLGWRIGGLINDSICAPYPKWKSCFVLSDVARVQVPNGLPSPSSPSIYLQNLSGPFSVAQSNISQGARAGVWMPESQPTFLQPILTGANCLWLHGDSGLKQPLHWVGCLKDEGGQRVKATDHSVREGCHEPKKY